MGRSTFRRYRLLELLDGGMPARERMRRLAAQLRPESTTSSSPSMESPMRRAIAPVPTASTASAPARQYLTPEQLSFMNTFGFVVLPGLVKDIIGDIDRAFSEVWEVDANGDPQRPGFGSQGPGMVHNDTGRTWSARPPNARARARARTHTPPPPLPPVQCSQCSPACTGSGPSSTSTRRCARCWTTRASAAPSPRCSGTTSPTGAATATSSPETLGVRRLLSPQLPNA